MEPVSSPTSASATLWLEPSLREIVSLISLFETTFTVRFNCLDRGSKLSTFTLTCVSGCSESVISGLTHFNDASKEVADFLRVMFDVFHVSNACSRSPYLRLLLHVIAH